MYDITTNIFMASYPVYMILTILLSWEHYVYTWHLTHYIWHHSHCISVITQMTHTSVLMYHWIKDITTSMVVMTLGKPMTSYTLYMTSHSHFITTMINFYDITATAFMTSNLLYMTSHLRFMTSHPLYLCHHSHYICSHPHYGCEFISTLFDIKHTVLRQYNHYIWHHTIRICICVITPTLLML